MQDVNVVFAMHDVLGKLVAKTGYKRIESLSFMHHLADIMQPNCILELGTAFGASAAYMALALDKGKKVVTVDNYSGMYAHSPTEVATVLEQLDVQDRVELVKGDTTRVDQALKGRAINVDLLFMDADHSYAGALSEYMTASNFLLKEHIVVIDDVIASRELANLITELSRKYPFSVIIKDFHWGMAAFCTNSEFLTYVSDAVFRVGQ